MYLKRNLIVTLVWLIVMNSNPQQSSAPALMPMPLSCQISNEKFRIAKDFQLSVTAPSNSRAYHAAERFLRRLSDRTTLFFSQGNICSDSVVQNPQCVFSCNERAALVVGVNESYHLAISNTGIALNAKTDLGILRGMETMLQLLSSDDEGFYFPICTIDDEPRFTWRGLMMDVSRHFMPVEIIKRNLDAMAAVKMNVFHWHLSDDQGFRVECKTFPQFHQLCSDGLYFTQEQIKEIIAYADERGIRVVPEFDIPGHSTSWLVAFPELASLPGPYKIERRWGIFDPVFDPTNEATYQFFDAFFKEITKLFPDEYVHIGGDENNGKQWNASPAIKDFMIKNSISDNHQLQAYFNGRILEILTKNNKRMMGWDEILHPQLPKNIVVHSWRGIKYLAESARQGYMGILSNGFYIDLALSAETHYKNEILPDSLNLSDEEKKRILGGEATMWAELVTPENVDSRIWPRTSAIAERFWSPASVNNIEDMYRRLDIISLQLEEHGILHLKNVEFMMRRLTNGLDIAPLKKIAELIEPLKRYERHRHQKYYYQYSPYTRLVDAIPPESRAAWNFSHDVDAYISGDQRKIASLYQFIDSHLENELKLRELISSAPGLFEVDSMITKSHQILTMFKEILAVSENNSKISPQLDQTVKDAIAIAKVPTAELQLMIIAPLEKLINRL